MREAARIPVLRTWHGYTGMFTREQAEGAIPNGDRVVKTNSQDGDPTADGTIGVVIGSIDVAAVAPGLSSKFNSKFIYFIEWNDMPMHVAGVRDFKIGKLS